MSWPDVCEQLAYWRKYPPLHVLARDVARCYGFQYTDDPDSSMPDNTDCPMPETVAVPVKPGDPPQFDPSRKPFDLLPVSVQAFVRKVQGKQ